MPQTEMQRGQLNMIACWLESVIHALLKKKLFSLMQPEALTFYVSFCVGLLHAHLIISLSLSLCNVNIRQKVWLLTYSP